MPKPSVYALAKALTQQHAFDIDVAFLGAWYGLGNSETPEVSYAQISARIDKVKWAPHLTEREASSYLSAYSAHKRAGSCPACEASARLRSNAERLLRKAKKPPCTASRSKSRSPTARSRTT